ncbi:dr1-associated corepressor-like [Actinia tenebrosa]|uniref:Dr1-associated corepressor n=1 Tax=Actinia tenebrosa TaxID=6105 RepID=A0A6P8I8V1_ACTTE|nr:dr1-associated corepressor-like [Actinia tenebrosa]
MPTKKKKFNARFPPARIKKIMQTDDDVGKVAAPVPVIISKALEMFMQTLVEKACLYTQSRNAKTLTTAHIKKCINSEQQFDFLKDLVEKIPDLPENEEEVEGEPKPKRRKQQPSNKEKDRPKRKRKNKKEEERIDMSDDSDDDQEEEEPDTDEDVSGSSESHSNHGNIHTNNISVSSNYASSAGPASKRPNLPVITVTKPETDNDDIFDSLPSTYKPTLNNISTSCQSIEEEDDDYDS